MASGLLRNPKAGRVWYPPARAPIPRAVDRAELVELLYREGGPKHGLRERSDAVDTLWRGYSYLRLRAEREDSGDFATTAEQTVVGLAFELQRRGAKAWDPTVAEGLEGTDRREALLRRRGSALTKLLDELAGAGLLVWGGERDNNGMWWRLRIRLVDPDEERPPDWEPWMRGIDPPKDTAADGSGGEGSEPRSLEPRPAATVDLASLYDRVEAISGHRPQLEARQVVQLRSAARRFAAHAAHRPAGALGEPLEVLVAQVEHHAPRDPRALPWALARFDAYSRQLQARGRARPSVPKPTREAPARTPESSVSPNCAALFNQPLNPNVSEVSALACTMGAPAAVDEMRDVKVGAFAEQSPGMAKQRTEGEGDKAEPFAVGGLLERVAAREELWKALSGPWRAAQAETVARARSWPQGLPVPIGLLTGAVEALEGHRPWLTEAQIDQLRRGERRYHRYASHRPAGAPPAAAAALMALTEQRPPNVAAGLPWAIAQLDLLSKRMRRAARRAETSERLPAARRRSERRRRRRAREGTTWFRRPGREAHAEMQHRVEALAEVVLVPGRLSTTVPYALLQLEDELRGEGHLSITGPQLREGLRDELHRRGAGVEVLAELDGCASASPVPVTFNPAEAQLTDSDRCALLDRPWLAQKRARRRHGAAVVGRALMRAGPTASGAESHAAPSHSANGPYPRSS